MQDYKKIIAWQHSHSLCLAVYRATSFFPAEERFGLTSPMRRSSVSVPSNIAEGSKRRSRKDYAHFLNQAQSSLGEVEYQIMLASDLGFLDQATSVVLLEQAQVAGRILNALHSAVENYGPRTTNKTTDH